MIAIAVEMIVKFGYLGSLNLIRTTQYELENLRWLA